MKSLNARCHKALVLTPFGITFGLGLLIGGLYCLLKQELNWEERHGSTDNTTFSKHGSTDNTTFPRHGSTDNTTFPTSQTCREIKTFAYTEVASKDYSTDCPDDNEAGPCNMKTLPCFCSIDINLPDTVEGDIVVSYKLDTFNDTVGEAPNFYQSRDDDQLKGNLSSNVSKSCEPFDYNDGIPIAPCGALADAMFTDKILDIYAASNGTQLPSIKYGLLHEEQKEGFRNPENISLNLDDLKKQFSKPRSWPKSIWELDPSNVDNNGFRNEAFIAWMAKDLSIKPMWRLDRNGTENMYARGLPSGTYVFSIQYNYPFTKYNGSRIIVINVEKINNITICDTVPPAGGELVLGNDEKDRLPILTAPAVSRQSNNYGIGIAAVVIGALLLVVYTSLVIHYKVTTGNIFKTKEPVGGSSGTIHPPQSSPPATQPLEEVPLRLLDHTQENLTEKTTEPAEMTQEVLKPLYSS